MKLLVKVQLCTVPAFGSPCVGVDSYAPKAIFLVRLDQGACSALQATSFHVAWVSMGKRPLTQLGWLGLVMDRKEDQERGWIGAALQIATVVSEETIWRAKEKPLFSAY